jgi:lipoate-protein ligase A
LRWVPYEIADGPLNMAIDEALLHTAANQGIATLRFYGWTEATVSLGYFQPAALLQPPSPLSGLPWVRRPTGGNALVHHHELTYALALPSGFSSDWMRRMHERVVMPALKALGVTGDLQIVEKANIAGDTLCFQQQTPGDLICASHKIAGSAQRKHRQCLLQHGSVLLARSVHALDLPGLWELAKVSVVVIDLEEALIRELQRETSWSIEKGNVCSEEMEWARDKADNQFRAASWNEKR